MVVVVVVVAITGVIIVAVVVVVVVWYNCVVFLCLNCVNAVLRVHFISVKYS